MSDVIQESPLKYTHAIMESSGYIVVKGSRTKDFHRDMTFDQFPNAPVFNSLEEAIEELPAFDGETFVMAFEENNVCDRLWFTSTQEENGLIERLNQYRMCYGGYGKSIYRV